MSITSLNAVYMISVSSVFPTPIQLQQFSTDDMFDTDALTVAEAQMGVDGFQTGGLVNNPVVQRITLMGDSISNDFFDTWNSSQIQAKDVFVASATIQMPSVSKKWTMVRGILVTYQPMPTAQKTLRPRPFSISWQNAVPQPM